MDFVTNIAERTKNNKNYRQVINTNSYMQVVLMSVGIGEDIEYEMHPYVDQFIRIEEGNGKLILGEKGKVQRVYKIQDDWAMVIPAGTYHRVVNTGNIPLKLYTIYAPPNHPKDKVQITRPEDEHL